MIDWPEFTQASLAIMMMTSGSVPCISAAPLYPRRSPPPQSLLPLPPPGVAGSLALLAAALKAPLVALYQISAEVVVMVALILFISES